MIVISVLIFSLIESLLVLPNHLAHGPGPRSKGPGNARPGLFRRLGQGISALQQRIDRELKRFIDGPLDRALQVATGQPGVVIAAGIAMIIVSVAMVPAGIIRVDFMPAVEADLVIASLEMPEGTPVARTTQVADALQDAGYRALGDAAPALISG